MAKMYPEKIPNSVSNDSKKSAEINVYNELNAQLSDEYKVYYSVNWIHKSKSFAENGETDFIIINPKKGILIVEVKGGQVGIESGQWYSIDKSNQKHSIKNPVEQCKNNRYSLEAKIKEHPRFKEPNPFLSYCVILPNSSRLSSDMGINAPLDIFIFREDLKQLSKRINQILTYWNQSLSTEEHIQILDSILSPSFVLKNPLIHLIQDDNKKMLELTENQFRILQSMKANKRVKINGGAGTGKTILALEKARQLSLEGFKTLFTCYSKPLAEYCFIAMKDFPNLTVLCYEDLCIEICKQTNIVLSQECLDKNKIEKQRLDQLTEYFVQALEKTKEIFDAIIVDEGQDFEKDWWTALELSLNEKKYGLFYIFFDDNQTVHLENQYIPENIFVYSLFENFRNTKTIFQLAIKFYSGQKLESKGPEGIKVKLISCSKEPKALHLKLETLVHKLIVEEKIKPEMIAILTGKNIRDSYLFTNPVLGKYKLNQVKDSNNGIVFESIKRFKGLERPIILLIELEEITTPGKFDIGLLYVGITRAQNHLIILGEEKPTLQLIRAKMN